MNSKKLISDSELDQLLSGHIRKTSERFNREAIEIIRDHKANQDRRVFVFPSWIPAAAGLAAVVAFAIFIVNRPTGSPDGSVAQTPETSEIAYASLPMFEDLFEMDAALTPAAATLNPEFLEALHSLSGEPL